MMKFAAVAPVMILATVATANAGDAAAELAKLSAERITRLEERQASLESRVAALESRSGPAASAGPRAEEIFRVDPSGNRTSQTVMVQPGGSVLSSRSAHGGMDGHTHRCSQGHVWDHSMDGGSHRCPKCGEYQNVVHSMGPAPAAGRFASGGCVNGACSTGACAAGGCDSGQCAGGQCGMRGQGKGPIRNLIARIRGG